MTNLNNIIKRAMSLMKAHVQYSQSLATEFSHLIKDYEDLVQAPEIIELDAQEEVELEAVSAEFEELMDNEPISVLRALMPYGVEENTEEVVIEKEAVQQSHENKELVGYRTIRTKKRILCRSKKVHSTKKKYECSICRKRFDQKSHLDKHTIVHTGKKQYECTFCKKRFGQKSVLERHTKIHSGEKPFECSICNKRFGRKSHLNRHCRLHTGEKNFECSIFR